MPFNKMLPMVNPNDIVLGGWDIHDRNLADAMENAQVLDLDLQKRLRPHMENLKPLPGIHFSEFVAENQYARANNLKTGTKQEQMEQIRQDIRTFKNHNNLDRVVVLWTANTERQCEVHEGLNDTETNLRSSVAKGETEVSPSTLFALACIDESTPFINGSPQNTFVPGVVEAAVRHNVLIGGDDFKSGQTKMKSALVDFLVGAGIKPTSIVSWNHLGNNDGYNLSSEKTFRSKEKSKSNVIDDVVNSNDTLYPSKDDKPDHCVVIKYVPYVGDSKRAMDEYSSEIFMHGRNTISMHNTCEDSLLAAPIILDLMLLAEMSTRIHVREGQSEKWQSLHPVSVLLSYLTKAPLVPNGVPVINALSKQRALLENMFRACIGLQPESNLHPALSSLL